MKVFTCVDHDSVWVGGASVVVAFDEAMAHALLEKELVKRGLKRGKFTLVELDTKYEHAIVLRDGDY